MSEGNGRDQEQRHKRCCVIGAGPSGLATMKELLAEGHEVVCYEAAEEIGRASCRERV